MSLQVSLHELPCRYLDQKHHFGVRHGIKQSDRAANMFRKRSEIKSETKSRSTSTAVSNAVFSDMDNITHEMYLGHWRFGELHGLGVLIEGSESAMEEQLEV